MCAFVCAFAFARVFACVCACARLPLRLFVRVCVRLRIFDGSCARVMYVYLLNVGVQVKISYIIYLLQQNNIYIKNIQFIFLLP